MIIRKIREKARGQACDLCRGAINRALAIARKISLLIGRSISISYALRGTRGAGVFAARSQRDIADEGRSLKAGGVYSSIQKANLKIEVKKRYPDTAVSSPPWLLPFSRIARLRSLTNVALLN